MQGSWLSPSRHHECMDSKIYSESFIDFFTEYQKRIFLLSALTLKDISNMFCPKMHLCPKPLPPLSKKVAFTSVIQDTNLIVGLKLLTTGTKVRTVLCTQTKYVVELVPKETDVSTHTFKLLFRKNLGHWDINILLL